MTEQSHLKVLWLQSGHYKEYSGFNEKTTKSETIWLLLECTSKIVTVYTNKLCFYIKINNKSGKI
jgi:hypothetical protein